MKKKVHLECDQPWTKHSLDTSLQWVCPKPSLVTGCCNTYWEPNPEHLALLKKGTTFDCPGCGSLRVVVNDQLIEADFHEWMHKQDPIWPKDGKNTGYIEFPA